MRLPALVRALLVAALASGAACKPSSSSAPLPLATERASDDSGEIQVEIAYLPSGDAVELQFRMSAVGTEEMDKIVLDVVLEGMILVDGGAQWSGFVPPRQPQKHRVVVRPLDNVETEPVVRVNLTRSRDSFLLMQKVIGFDTAGGSLTPVTR